jgi:hypothetical protein
MKRLLLETILSFMTGALVLYAAMTSLKNFGEPHPPGPDAVPVAASRQAANVRCSTCFALARREGY